MQDWKRGFLHVTNRLDSLKTGWLVLEIYKQPSLFINKQIHTSQFINKLASLQTDKNLQTDYDIYIAKEK